MTVDYAWMRARTKYREQLCQWHGANQIEHKDDHKIGYFSYGGASGPGPIEHSSGVFDDCFIEIAEGNEYDNQPYQLAMDGSDGPDYWEYPSWWTPAQNDTVLLIGVDHILEQCLEPDPWRGYTPINLVVEAKDFWCYTGVGFASDASLNGKTRRIDGREYNKHPYPTLNTSAHELVHDFVQIGNDYHINNNYGLMCPGNVTMVAIKRDGVYQVVPARRSYLNSIKIIDLRSQLLIFDENSN